MILRLVSGVVVGLIGIAVIITGWLGLPSEEIVGAPGWLITFVGLLLLESADAKRGK
jgi:hypothetical protein